MTDELVTDWDQFQKNYHEFPEIRLAIDVSRVGFPGDHFTRHQSTIQKVFLAMDDLEAGGIANPDENRMVGHYWLRDPERAPSLAVAKEIKDTVEAVTEFARSVHRGDVVGAHGVFKHALVIGIGGSALGPQFVSHALGHPQADRMTLHFFDNTDPDGIDLVLARLSGQLGRTLCIVISKSGETKETRNGMEEARAAYARASLCFEKHAVAITTSGMKLDKLARGIEPKGVPWLAVFPMWDWVGGRTSETSAVGLLPAALQGIDVRALLSGARACDAVTRGHDVAANPAAQLALAWHYIGAGRGEKDMVVIPYKDRLLLLSRYLQQLVMESLGKELDLDGRVVNQGLAVYGNKGSTDQHAYVQQLRDGLHNFFVVFIEVLKDGAATAPRVEIEPGVTSGDYLSGFLLGTRDALYERGRRSITLTIDEVAPFAVGVLIALFERAVGFYAFLVNINAYHQPGVQAGKTAADRVLLLQRKICDCFTRLSAERPAKPITAQVLSRMLGFPGQAEMVFKICQHLAANPGHGIRRTGGASAATACYEPE